MLRAKRHRQRTLAARTPPALEVFPASGAPCVVYLCPHSDRPTGGVRVIYRHVDTLRALSIEAVVLHPEGGPGMSWFEHETPIETSKACGATSRSSTARTLGSEWVRK